jgi:L-phenylalanine/L-methionine N-acetyltransferase
VTAARGTRKQERVRAPARSPARVDVRALEPDDFAALHAIYLCPSVIAGTLQLPLPSVDLWRQRIAAIPEGDRHFVAILYEEVVGHLFLRQHVKWPRRAHTGTIGIAVHERAQGRGVATQLLKAGLDIADNWLNIKRMELEVYADNLAAVELYKRAGFITEGTLRGYALRDGAFVDCLYMARRLKV